MINGKRPNASVDKSLSSVKELLIYIIFEKETNGPHGTALSSTKRLFGEQFEGKHKLILLGNERSASPLKSSYACCNETALYFQPVIYYVFRKQTRECDLAIW